MPRTATVTGVDTVSIRAADREDLLAIHRIERRSFPQPWPLSAFEGFLDEDGFLVATEGGSVIGYVVGDVVNGPEGPAGHVKDLAVHPSCRRRGVGRRLLGRLLEHLNSRPIDHVRLEVRESNRPAIELYRGFGFRTSRRIPAYYENAEDALVMIADPDVGAAGSGGP